MLRRQLLHFSIAGSLGFLIDASITQSLVRFVGSDPFLARAVAVCLAILFTFGYNRAITFAGQGSERRWQQFARYLAGNSVGLIANYAVFVACLAVWPWLRTWPALAVAAGALAGMGVNFVAARDLVFKRSTERS
jgi:putative flippase GtrA